MHVVEYRLEGVVGAAYWLVTTIFDAAQAPAAELAARYHERREIEGALAELKTQLRGARRAAQQDPGAGSAGVLGPIAGAFRRARAELNGDAGRSGAPANLASRELSDKRAMSGQAAAVRKFWAEDGNPDKMIVGQVDGQGARVMLIGYIRISTLDLQRRSQRFQSGQG